jgi:phytoene dehydrogenase-like protein
VSILSHHQDDIGWWLRHAPILPWRLWPLIRDRHATLSDTLRHYFGDDEAVKLALISNLAYYSDDPDTMPLVAFAVPQASYLVGGGHYVRGGSQVLSDRLVAIVRESGGEAESARDVCAILLDGDRVRGVQHRARGADDLREDLAPVVFGNAAPGVLSAMLPEGARPQFEARYRTQCPSISLWTISLGLDRRSADFGVRRYSTAILPTWLTSIRELKDAGRLMGEDPGIRLPPYGVAAYDQIDSGLNETGPFLVTMVGVDRLENWSGLDADAVRARKARWMNRLLADLNVQFPGIETAIIHREMSTAETFHHYLNTPDGAIYGFAPHTRGFMPLTTTSIAGLYLASAYTGGGGFTGAIVGGAWAARAALVRSRSRPR